ncbi:hypothetical protein Tco_0542311 [Tanacetum coccineum]
MATYLVSRVEYSISLRIMANGYKCFYEKKANGFIQFICFLVADFENELVLRLEVWPFSCLSDENYVDLVDAKGVVHLVKMNRNLEPFVWSFNGDKWIDFMSTFKLLDSKIIHFDQINCNRFLVNFYTKDGDEVGYGFTKDHVYKCLVSGCHDPRIYQPIPHKMLLNSKRVLDCKRVPIEFNGVVSDMGISFSLFSKLRKVVGVAFTGPEWERVCESEMFSASKVIVISSDEYGGSFVGKVIHEFVYDTDFVTKIISGPGESSNSAVVSEKSFIIVFSSCAKTKGYMSIPTAFHCHQMRAVYHEVWINANGRSLYMCMKIHIDKRSKSEKSTSVHLVGEMRRLKEVLDINVGDMIHFELVSGNITSDELFNDYNLRNNGHKATEDIDRKTNMVEVEKEYQ